MHPWAAGVHGTTVGGVWDSHKAKLDSLLWVVVGNSYPY